MIDIIRDEIFQKNSLVYPSWPQKEWRNFGGVESRTTWWETKKIQIKLTTTCNKNEQQNVKNNAEWTKMTWKIFEEIIRGGWNMSVKA